jgi:hypothetical protein
MIAPRKITRKARKIQLPPARAIGVIAPSVAGHRAGVQ